MNISKSIYLLVILNSYSILVIAAGLYDTPESAWVLVLAVVFCLCHKGKIKCHTPACKMPDSTKYPIKNNVPIATGC